MIRVAFHRGTAFVSHLIRFWTQSGHSHADTWFFRDPDLGGLIPRNMGVFGSIISADAKGVVEKPIEGWMFARTSGKLGVDLLAWKEELTTDQQQKLYLAAKRMVGWKYDYENVFLGFPLMKRRAFKSGKKKGFCSEIVLEEVEDANRQGAFIPPLLERYRAWREPPESIYKSPALKFDKTLFLK